MSNQLLIKVKTVRAGAADVHDAHDCVACGKEFRLMYHTNQEIGFAYFGTDLVSGEWFGDVCGDCIEAGEERLAALLRSRAMVLRREADVLEQRSARGHVRFIREPTQEAMEQLISEIETFLDDDEPSSGTPANEA